MPIPKHILDKIRSNDTTLNELNLSRQSPSLNDNDIRILVEALASNTTITSLIFSENDITSNGAALLAAMLVKKPHITTLDLSINNVDDSGASLLLQISSLRYLDLSANALTDTIVPEIKKIIFLKPC